MSRSYERAMRKMELRQADLLREAFYRVEASEELRYFLRWLLESCGYGSAPTGVDQLTMARECGMLSVAAFLCEAANQFTPSLLPLIIKEQNDDRNSLAQYTDSADD